MSVEEEFKAAIIESWRVNGRARTVEQGAEMAWQVAKQFLAEEPEAEATCDGCYESFSGPWCDNCGTWPCECVWGTKRS